MAFGLTEVPKQYPVGEEPLAQATENDIESLVAIYENNIVLLAGGEDYAVSLADIQVDPALAAALANAAGTPPTLEGLINGLTAAIEADPKSGVPAVLAAAAVIKASGDSEIKGSGLDVLAASVRVISEQPEAGTTAADVATLITFAADKAPVEHRAELIRSLRSMAVSQINPEDQADYALAVDSAMAGLKSLNAAKANEQLLALAKSRLPNRNEGDVIDDPFDFLNDGAFGLGFPGWDAFGDLELTGFSTGFQNPPVGSTPFLSPPVPNPTPVPGRNRPGPPPGPPPVSP